MWGEIARPGPWEAVGATCNVGSHGRIFKQLRGEIRLTWWDLADDYKEAGMDRVGSNKLFVHLAIS